MNEAARRLGYRCSTLVARRLRELAEAGAVKRVRCGRRSVYVVDGCRLVNFYEVVVDYALRRGWRWLSWRWIRRFVEGEMRHRRVLHVSASNWLREVEVVLRRRGVRYRKVRVASDGGDYVKIILEG